VLDGRLHVPDLENANMTADEAPTSIRLAPDLLRRVDAMAERLGSLTGIPVSRSAVLRLAVERGLDALESEHGKAKRK
jgi:hypothetical protein